VRDGAVLADWEDAGFTELVTPLRPPTDERGADRVTVWMRLPEGATLTTERGPDGPRLKMPTGAEVDRVELHDDGVAVRVEDVRGTEFLDGREEFHVIVRAEGGLRGFAWDRADAAAQAAVDRELGSLVGPARSRRLVGFNQCASCHQPARPAATSVGSGPHRPTDASGLYHVQAVLAEELPLERNRPVDANLDDPHFSARCLSGESPSVRASKGTRHLECPAGEVVWGRYAVAEALAAGAPHASAVCASRRYLFEHLDDEGRAAFSSAFVACGISTPRASSDQQKE
jgi:hypothetical protein